MGVPEGGVREFYAGRSVFITGATGYLGKVTVEKLLWSCPEINKIYMMVRPKAGKTPNDRLKELCNSPIFNRLKEIKSDFRRKIMLIPGDIEEDGLGMSDIDIAVVTSETSVIIHNAATVRFTEPLKKAVKINIIGLQQMVMLAKHMKKLEAFVHVSTAYSNCTKEVINERIYPQRMTPQQLIHTVSWMTEKEIEDLTPMFLEDYPNTYTFTKAVAEILLDEERGDIPVAIVRPSIIVSSHSDPVPGWIDGLTGANGLFALQGQGTLRKMQGYNSKIADLIPVDMMANSSIVAGWKLAKDRPKQTLVMNITSGQLNPILWGDMYTFGAEQQYKFPSKTVIRPPVSNMYTEYTLVRNIYKVLDHFMPAYIFDFISRITFQKPRYYKAVRGLWRFAQSVEYFTNRQWFFTNDNAIGVLKDMAPDERKTFNFDMTTIDWRKFSKFWWLGTKYYIWGEEPSEQPQYDRRFSWILMRRRLTWLLFGGLITVAVGHKTYPLALPYYEHIFKHASVAIEKMQPRAMLKY